jgi:putative DNA primase/helicase
MNTQNQPHLNGSEALIAESHKNKMTCDFEMAEKFLKALDPEATKFTFQTFYDPKNKKLSKKEKKEYARIFHGRFYDLAPKLSEMNKRGAGVFVAVNETDFHGRSEKNIVGLRSAFVDADNGPIEKFALKPSIIVDTKNGLHGYWRLKLNEPLELFTRLQLNLSWHLNTDPSVSDLPRAMRLAGFFHQKNSQAPFLITVREVNDLAYSIEEIYQAYPPRREDV